MAFTTAEIGIELLMEVTNGLADQQQNCSKRANPSRATQPSPVEAFVCENPHRPLAPGDSRAA
jgi:hypothetical protein